MSGNTRYRPAAFTLIELLAVIAIISLLIGMLVPAVSNVRDQAKRTVTLGRLKGLADGCEGFNTALGEYPASRGLNPFEGDSSVYLSGAQWLALQTAGPDLRGYVEPIKRNDTNGDDLIDEQDWLTWYDNESAGQYSRLSPFVQADGKIAQTPTIYKREHSFVGDIPDALKEGGSGAGSSVWNNSRLPFYVDAFGYPILYYRAEAYAKQPISTGSPPSLEVGIYDQTDNAIFTGSEGGDGYFGRAQPGWDLGAGPEPELNPLYHPLAILGYKASAPYDLPERKSFTYSIFDIRQYEMTDTGSGGQIRPARPDTFMLISPGKDGRYGTLEDVRSF